jgi:propionyl-CoA carboxylase alpha chain
VYAEDPLNNFLPDIGKLITYERPMGPGVRVDDGFEEGMDIPIYYDPMIAKLIVHAADRNAAIAKMTRAIADYQVTGVQTTLPFCSWAINHEAFVSGDFDTHFVKKYFTPEVLHQRTDEEAMIAAALATKVHSQKKQVMHNALKKNSDSWKRRF